MKTILSRSISSYLNFLKGLNKRVLQTEVINPTLQLLFKFKNVIDKVLMTIIASFLLNEQIRVRSAK